MTVPHFYNLTLQCTVFKCCHSFSCQNTCLW